MHKLIMTILVSLAAILSTGANADSTLQSFEPASLTQIVEKQKGKPFVLVVWSLDCEYCQTSLKTLSQKKHKLKELVVVTLSTDSLNDPQAAALMRARLASLGMTDNAWAFGSAPAEQLRYAIDPKWHGEKPRSYWFNLRGDKAAYSGVLTTDMINKLSSR